MRLQCYGGPCDGQSVLVTDETPVGKAVAVPVTPHLPIARAPVRWKGPTADYVIVRRGGTLVAIYKPVAAPH